MHISFDFLLDLLFLGSQFVDKVVMPIDKSGRQESHIAQNGAELGPYPAAVLAVEVFGLTDFLVIFSGIYPTPSKLHH